MNEQDLNPTSAAIQEAFAVSYSPEQFRAELEERGLSLQVYFPENVAVHEGKRYPIPAEMQKWAGLALKRNPTLNDIHDGFGLENGADFVFHLEERNISLAKPDAGDCEDYGLKPGELVAVSEDGSLYPLREEFEAHEASLKGKWIEEDQEFYTPRSYDEFMERAGFFYSIDDARAYITPEAVEKRNNEAVAFYVDRAFGKVEDGYFINEKGSDFSYALETRNIVLARPTAEEARALDLQEGELYAVSRNGAFRLDREAFNARERELDGRWSEDRKEHYRAWDFDKYMRTAGVFNSVADAREYIAPEAVAKREAEYEADKAQWEAGRSSGRKAEKDERATEATGSEQRDDGRGGTDAKTRQAQSNRHPSRSGGNRHSTGGGRGR
jgi:hypothetical protein